MDLNVFLEQFAEQFDSLETSPLTANVCFKELKDYSSLLALMIMTMIDEEYGVIVSGDDMMNVSTIDELFTLVSSRK
jgi:acyl carrier protein